MCSDSRSRVEPESTNSDENVTNMSEGGNIFCADSRQKSNLRPVQGRKPDLFCDGHSENNSGGNACNMSKEKNALFADSRYGSNLTQTPRRETDLICDGVLDLVQMAARQAFWMDRIMSLMVLVGQIQDL